MLWSDFKNYRTVYFKHISLSQCLDTEFLIDLLSFESSCKKDALFSNSMSFPRCRSSGITKKYRGCVTLIVLASVKSCKGRKIQASKLWAYSSSLHIFTCRELCAVCHNPFSR